MAEKKPKLKLSKKAKAFIKSVMQPDQKVIVLEGTTQASKTSDVAIVVPLLVMNSKEKFHIIAGNQVSSIEKNYLHDPVVGILALYPNCEYFGNGNKDNKRPHLKVHMPDGSFKVIYIMSFSNSDEYKNFRTGTYGVIVLDEFNLCHPFVTSEAMLRGKEKRILTLNPDTPTKPCYDTVNHCRPLDEWKSEYPDALLNMLNKEHYDGWTHWYFTFEDNASLSKERIEEIKRSEEKGTARYTSLILGLRVKPSGLVFPQFSRERNTWDDIMIRQYTSKDENEFIAFSAGCDTSYSSKSEDTLAMLFCGVTASRKLIILDELVINNAELAKQNKPLISPSKLCIMYNQFCDDNYEKWCPTNDIPFSDIYLDSADQATRSQWMEILNESSDIQLNYNLIASFKKMKIIDRVRLMDGWITHGDYIINTKCENHIREISGYEYEEGTTKPKDIDNHTIDAAAYMWMPLHQNSHLIGNLFLYD